jgi:hypothetical protein
MESKTKLVKELVKVIKRLSLNQQSMCFRYNNFDATIKKIELPKPSFFDAILFKKTDKQELSEYIEVKYYQGKIMAYMFVLGQLVGEVKANKLLYQGILGEKNIDKYGRKIKK